jgi:oxygen-independent coproporphyrinogen-3 oxidase
MAGIYLHIPFCRQACHYCDFHFSTQQDKKGEMVAAIARELELRRDYLQGEGIDTVYLGGGTPSLLSVDELSFLFDSIRKNFSLSEAAEVTLEANPDDLSRETLPALWKAGINRLSIGIQSFDDQVLQFLNRAHNGKAAIDCIDYARNAGFSNISIDLIYAIPGQDDNTWLKNVLLALALKPEHISSYSLTIEEKTVFGRWAAKGKLGLVDDDQAAIQLELLVSTLEQGGFEQYEVSNFARPGFQSKHNSSYWKQEKYLGVGPSAHSYDGATRQYNVSNNHLYLKALEKETIPFIRESLSREDMINDYLLTTLRTSWGSDLKKLQNDFGYDVLSSHGAYVHSLLEKGIAVLQNDTLILTRQGKLLADKISADLFAVR